MTHGHINYSGDDPDDDGSTIRKCPHCQTSIRWRDFSGLATTAWHYPDSIITQAVVTLGGEEVDNHPLSKSKQTCGKCGGDVSAVQMR